MTKICPECKSIAEYNAYYGRVTCTRCNWESEKTVKPAHITPYHVVGASLLSNKKMKRVVKSK